MVNYSDETFSGTGATNYVMLELARRSSGDTEGITIGENRIGLLCQSIDITTNKQSLAFPVPFTGIISGESKTIAIDLGLATKKSFSGKIILDGWNLGGNLP